MGNSNYALKGILIVADQSGRPSTEEKLTGELLGRRVAKLTLRMYYPSLCET